MQLSDKKMYSLGIVFFSLIMFSWALGIFVAPSEFYQGEVYRIIYIHVPSAVTALAVASFAMMIFSVLGFLKKQDKYLYGAKAWAEVGLIFTIVTLMTGSIWGRTTWGVWWAWDARLTTTLLLAILLIGYQLVYSSLPPGNQRVRICSVLGIIIFVDIPIIYKSVSWWRTLHQPTSLLRTGGSTMAPEILHILFINFLFVIMLAIWFWHIRFKNLLLQDKIERLSYESCNKNSGSLERQ